MLLVVVSRVPRALDMTVLFNLPLSAISSLCLNPLWQRRCIHLGTKLPKAKMEAGDSGSDSLSRKRVAAG